MPYRIFYDSYQEGIWFRSLHGSLHKADLEPFPGSVAGNHPLARVLSYDRPDIVLVDDDAPILIVERTVEVPSGHNVGQRFARLVAAAECGVPVVYFGPYKAYKHGGETQGPRYMNLRLFYALAHMARIEHTAVTTINWPVDADCEVVRTDAKDARMRQYLDLFFTLYRSHSLRDVSKALMTSDFEIEQEEERRQFIANDVRSPGQYNGPPATVRIGPIGNFPEIKKSAPNAKRHNEIVVYIVGMRHIRSDPYTGTAMLYAYLYCGGMKHRTRSLILQFPHISIGQWKAAAARKTRKDIRLFRLAADGILFADGYTLKSELP